MMSGPNLPDLNPLDCYVWGNTGVLSQAAIEAKNSSEFEHALQSIWSVLLERAIDNAVKDYRKRLQACVSVNGR